MSHYNVIIDNNKLLEFIEWLPDLAENEKFYCCLFARKKYSDGKITSNDKGQLKRFLSDKKRLFEKIKQLEAPVGSYTIRGESVPQESLALYINPNPRDLKKASFDSIIKLTDLLQKDQKGYNPHAEVLSCVQRATSRQVYLDFDVDSKTFDFSGLKAAINTSCLTILQTRGGFHILVKVDEIEPEYKKGFYNKIVALGVDQSGDQLLPIPGCVQGGFSPEFIKVF
ncbi:MAG: hypothetical protein MRY83_06675 [Flavobacteriales bacterium]|nr:hypothetical protein [Flavobacteriales bacterium]